MEILADRVEILHAVLQTERFGRRCRWFDAVDSTNSVALAWARQGAGTGALVVAEFQRKGRGRFKRSWTAEPERNLTFSTIIDAEDLGGRLEFLPIALAVAVAETLIQNLEPHRSLIKWPNDVMLAGRKVGGILIESFIPSSVETTGGHAVSGIGLNVNQERFPDDLKDIATSIFQIHGRQVDRVALLAELLLAIESVFRKMVNGETADLIRRYESMMYGIGQMVGYSRVDTPVDGEGTVLGIDPSGGLRVRTRTGIEILRAGEITFRQQDRDPLRTNSHPRPPHPTSSS